MVILALLKSDGRTPLQWWTFREAKAISVGRSLSNQVIVRNSHVSRKHFELCPIASSSSQGEPLSDISDASHSHSAQAQDSRSSPSGSRVRWRIISHGKNGTYLNGRLIEEAEVFDDDTVQLAPKGPKLKIYLRTRVPRRDRLPKSSPKAPQPQEQLSQEQLSQALGSVSVSQDSALGQGASADYAYGTVPTGTLPNRLVEEALSRLSNSEPLDQLRSSTIRDRFPAPSGPILASAAISSDRPSTLSSSAPQSSPPPVPESEASGTECRHVGNPPGNLLCCRCGQPLRVIRTVKQYQLLRLLGQGGMGTTYLAWRLLPDTGVLSSSSPSAATAISLTPGQRLVVVKQLNPDVSAIAKARELFEREAAVLQKMDHPGIPKFLDAFSDGEQSYLAMELVHGQDLEQYILKQGAIDKEQAIQWMQQTCDVLHHLHTQHPPIIHRDIKPANLLRQYRDKRIVVVDFGAVKSMVGAMGTRIKAEGYTAPEQEAGKPTIASDLYSVAATLVFLLTRKSPLDFYISAEEVSFAEVPQIPLDLAKVLTKALALEACDRHSSALELKLALGSCLDGQ